MSIQLIDSRLPQYINLSTDVEGFFHPKHAAIWDIFYLIQKELGLSGSLMEIGVLHGRSAIMSILHMDASREHIDLVDIELRPTLQATMDKLPKESTAKVNYIIGDSKETITPEFLKQGANAYRWIHIDGEHTYKGAYSDLQNADALLMEDGLICCDDFFNPRYPQITDAVFRYLYTHSDRISLLVVGHNKGYLCRPKAHAKYFSRIQNDLVALMAERDVECVVFKGMVNGQYCLGMR